MAGQHIFKVSNINIYINLGVFKEKEVALLVDDAAIQTKYADYVLILIGPIVVSRHRSRQINICTEHLAAIQAAALTVTMTTSSSANFYLVS